MSGKIVASELSELFVEHLQQMLNRSPRPTRSKTVFDSEARHDGVVMPNESALRRLDEALTRATFGDSGPSLSELKEHIAEDLLRSLLGEAQHIPSTASNAFFMIAHLTKGCEREGKSTKGLIPLPELMRGLGYLIQIEELDDPLRKFCLEAGDFRLDALRVHLESVLGDSDCVATFLLETVQTLIRKSKSDAYTLVNQVTEETTVCGPPDPDNVKRLVGTRIYTLLNHIIDAWIQDRHM